MKKLVFSLFVLLVAAPAWAQSTLTNAQHNVTLTVPTGWESDSQNDERAAFNLRHTDHSQIEVIGNDLLTAEVSTVFFRHFHETLQASQFMAAGQEDKTVGDVSGTETVYRFDHSNATLKVAVFQFVRGTTAWLVILYSQEDVFDAHVAEFRSVISGLAFQG